MTEVVVRAPGRANLIGEHTDYNEGFVLPIAIDLETTIRGCRAPGRVSLVSGAAEGRVEVDVADPSMPDEGWGCYVAGVVLALRDAGVPVAGLEGEVTSTVPVGAGLSSSAALEVAIALALVETEVSPVDLAQVCRRAENAYVGLASGIMDQLTSAAARPGHACLIDCRDNAMTHVPLPPGVRVLLFDSGVTRTLAGSAFNERVEECKEAARQLGIRSLRDARSEDLSRLDQRLRRRARHVIAENVRTLAVVDAFRDGDLTSVGRLFHESHLSYSQDFEASTPQIDRLLALTADTEGVLASRLTGGGWGGCTVSLIAPEADPDNVAQEIATRYERETGIVSNWWVTHAAAGAARLV